VARKREKVIKLNLRLPKGLHHHLERQAAQGGRSLNSEIIDRLRRSVTTGEIARRLQLDALNTYTLDAQLMGMVKKALIDISEHLYQAVPVSLREYPTHQTKDGDKQ
jgi:plasmid stability protein